MYPNTTPFILGCYYWFLQNCSWPYQTRAIIKIPLNISPHPIPIPPLFPPFSSFFYPSLSSFIHSFPLFLPSLHSLHLCCWRYFFFHFWKHNEIIILFLCLCNTMELWFCLLQIMQQPIFFFGNNRILLCWLCRSMDWNTYIFDEVTMPPRWKKYRWWKSRFLLPILPFIWSRA